MAQVNGNGTEQLLVEEPKVVPEVVVEETVEPTAQDNNQNNTQDNSTEKRETRAEKYEKLEKSYNELRSFSDKRYNESLKTMEALKKELDFFAPYKDALAKAMEEKKQEELRALYEKDPLEAQKRLVADATKAQEAQLRAQYEPVQQQMEQAKNAEFANQAIDYLQKTYGEEVYKAAEGPMEQILTETMQTQGPEVARLLAQNPDALFNMAFGRVAINYIRQNNATKAQAATNQNRAAQFANGVSKPNNVSSRQVSNANEMSDEELEKAFYAELAQKANRR